MEKCKVIKACFRATNLYNDGYIIIFPETNEIFGLFTDDFAVISFNKDTIYFDFFVNDLDSPESLVYEICSFKKLYLGTLEMSPSSFFEGNNEISLQDIDTGENATLYVLGEEKDANIIDRILEIINKK